MQTFAAILDATAAKAPITDETRACRLVEMASSTSGGDVTSGSLDTTVTSVAHYDRLLQQINELQSDLGRTLSVAQSLRTENDSLRAGYEKVKQELTRMKGKHDAVRQQYMDEAEARLELEQKHEELVSEWKQQLESKEQEFLAMQEQMAPPRDLDVLRVRIQEELEVPHQKHVAELEAAIEKHRALYFTSKREAELLKAEFEQSSADHAADAEATAAAHTAQVKTLKRRIADLEERLDGDGRTAADALRAAQAAADDAAVARARLAAEATEMREQRDAARTALESAQAEAQASSLRLKSEAGAAANDAAAADRRALTAEEEAARLRGALATANTQLASLERSNTRLEAKVSTLEARVRDDAATAADKADAAAAAWAREREDLQATARAASRRAEGAEDRVRQLEGDALASAREHAASMSALQRRVEAAEAGQKQAPPAGAGQLIALGSQAQIDAATGPVVMVSTSEIRELREEATTAHAAATSSAEECDRLRAELVDVTAKLRSAEERAARSIDSLGSAQASHKEVQGEYQSLRAQHTDALARISSLTAEVEALKGRCGGLAQRVSDATASAASSRRAASDATRAVAAAKAQGEASKASLQSAHEQEIDSLRTEAAKALARSKKKGEEYKRKLLELWRRYQQVKAVLSATQQERDAVADSKDSEVQAMRRRVADLQRERDLLLHSSSHASAAPASTGSSTWTTQAAASKETINQHLAAMSVPPI